MYGIRKINSIKIHMNDKDGYDIIEAIEMAQNEGVFNRSGKLKTILESFLYKGDIE